MAVSLGEHDNLVEAMSVKFNTDGLMQPGPESRAIGDATVRKVRGHFECP